MWLKLGRHSLGGAIDLCDLGLDAIEETPDAFRIGAMATLRQLETHPGLAAYTCGAARDGGPEAAGGRRDVPGLDASRSAGPTRDARPRDGWMPTARRPDGERRGGRDCAKRPERGADDRTNTAWTRLYLQNLTNIQIE